LSPLARRLGEQETHKAITNMIDSGLDEQTAHDTYSAVSELVRGSVLLARMTQKHSAAQETESADEGEFTSAPTPLNDRAFELLLTSVLALVR
jgi:Arc/MetJ-type ribon-helix-helix transcriptional regulator